MADAEAKAAWVAYPNDEESQFRAQVRARAARQPEPDRAAEVEPKQCAYYKWLQGTGEGDYIPNWVYYGGGGSGDGNGGSGGGGGGGSEADGLEKHACEYGCVSDGSADSDFDFGDGWDA